MCEIGFHLNMVCCIGYVKIRSIKHGESHTMNPKPKHLHLDLEDEGCLIVTVATKCLQIVNG